MFPFEINHRPLSSAEPAPVKIAPPLKKEKKESKQPYGDVTRDDAQQRFLAQHSVAMLEQCCKDSKQCCNNVAMLCWAKNHRGKSSSVTSLLDTLTIRKGQLFFFFN